MELRMWQLKKRSKIELNLPVPFEYQSGAKLTKIWEASILLPIYFIFSHLFDTWKLEFWQTGEISGQNGYALISIMDRQIHLTFYLFQIAMCGMTVASFFFKWESRNYSPIKLGAPRKDPALPQLSHFAPLHLNILKLTFYIEWPWILLWISKMTFLILFIHGIFKWKKQATACM